MKSLKKATLAAGLACALLFSCSPKPHANPVNPEESQTSQPSSSPSEGKKAFLQDFTSSLHDGVSFQAGDNTQFILDHEVGDSANVLDFSGVGIDFALDGLSLHKMKLALDAPISYNGKARSLGVFLANDTLLCDVDLSRSESESALTKFRMDLAEIVLDGQNGNDLSYDSSLNGYACYQYGDFSWMMEEMLDLISGGDGSSTGDASFSLSWDALASSLNAIEETSIDGLPYFTWNMTLEEGGESYPIGLQGDSSYRFSRIDFPAKTSNQSVLTFGDEGKFHLKGSLSVETKADQKDWSLPSDASDYPLLRDSTALFRRLGKVVKERKFGVDGTLLLTHEEEEIPTTSTSFGHAKIDESLQIDLSADLEFQGSSIQELGAEISLSDALGSSNAENRMGVHLYGEEGENAKKVFLNLNDALKAQTTKPILDELFSRISEALGDESIQNDAFTGIATTTGAIGEAIDAYKNGALNQGIQNGRYDFILDAIQGLETSQNNVSLSLDFSKLGFASGTAHIVLRDGDSMASIDITNLALGPFSVQSATLTVRDFSMKEVEDPSSYDPWNHLPSLSDQIRDLAQTDRATFEVSGYALKLGTATCADHSGYNRPEQGFVFSGSFAFDLAKKKGAGKATFTDRQEKYVNDHNIDLEITGPSQIDESTGFDANRMIFRYDSQNATSEKDENRTEPSNKNGMSGYFSIHSLNDILGLVMDFLNSDDPRFERLLNSFSDMSTESLIGKIGNGLYLEALKSPLLDSCVSSLNQDVLTFPTSAFGTKTPLILTLEYGDSGSEDPGKGPLKSLRIQATMGEDDSQTEMDITLSITSLDASDSALSHFSDLTGFTDYSSVSNLAAYLIDTASLGVTKDNPVTTYHLSIDASAKILGLGVTLTGDGYVMVDGASVSAYVKTHINYFFMVTNAETYAECYYHSSANDPEGFALMRRATKSGFSWKQDQKKVRGKDLLANILTWIMSYMLNMSSSIVGAIESSDTSGSLTHPEDALTSYSGPAENDATETPAFSIGLDLGVIAHSSVNMKINANLHGDYVEIDSKKMKTLSTADGTLAIKVGITLNVNFGLTLANAQNHVYSPCWDDSQTYRNGKNNVSGTVSSIFETLVGKETDNGFEYSSNFSSISEWSTKP